MAVEHKKVRAESHLINQAHDRRIPFPDAYGVVRTGDAVSKDLVENLLGRQPGINFDGVGRNEIPIRVKMSWDADYCISSRRTG